MMPIALGKAKMLTWKSVAILLLVLLFLTESTRWMSNKGLSATLLLQQQQDHDADNVDNNEPIGIRDDQVLIRRQLLKRLPSTTEVSLQALLKEETPSPNQQNENSSRLSSKVSQNQNDIKQYKTTSEPEDGKISNFKASMCRNLKCTHKCRKGIV